jgi:hypothetical protein
MQVGIAEKLPMRLRLNPDNMSPDQIYLFVARVCMFVTPHSIDIQRCDWQFFQWPLFLYATLEVDRCGWYWGVWWRSLDLHAHRNYIVARLE